VSKDQQVLLDVPAGGEEQESAEKTEKSVRWVNMAQLENLELLDLRVVLVELVKQGVTEKMGHWVDQEFVVLRVVLEGQV